MAKPYLNKAERELFLKVGAAVQVFDDMEAAFAKQNNKDALKFTRMARSLTQKIFDCRVKELDDVAALKLVAEANASRIVLRTNDYKVNVDAPEKDGHVELPVEWYRELIADALEVSCQTCSLRGGALVKECSRRKMFVLTDVPMVDELCGEDACPYQRR